MTDQELYDELRRFILKNFLKGHDPAALTPSTPLISSGLLDSLAVTEVLMLLEERLNVQFDPTESEPGRFDTLDLMVHAARQRVKKDAG